MCISHTYMRWRKIDKTEKCWIKASSIHGKLCGWNPIAWAAFEYISKLLLEDFNPLDDMTTVIQLNYLSRCFHIHLKWYSSDVFSLDVKENQWKMNNKLSSKWWSLINQSTRAAITFMNFWKAKKCWSLRGFFFSRLHAFWSK